MRCANASGFSRYYIPWEQTTKQIKVGEEEDAERSKIAASTFTKQVNKRGFAINYFIATKRGWWEKI